MTYLISQRESILISDTALNIYTDGSSQSSPRRGGIGYKYIYYDANGEEKIEYPSPRFGIKEATNNEMELYAVIEALKDAVAIIEKEYFSKVVVYTDSRYVSDNYKRAIFQWQQSKWVNRNGRPIQNVGLWKEFIHITKKLRKVVEIKWVKGHAKDIHNKDVDAIAKKTAVVALNKPISLSIVRRKISNKKTVIGSVLMEGQSMCIHVITSSYLNTHKLSKYRYEVMSKCSKYFGNVDVIFSEHNLRTNHFFKVRVNDTTANPRILEVLKHYPKISSTNNDSDIPTMPIDGT